MTDWNLPWTAGCRCDRLRMRISEAPIVTMACHCTGCQPRPNCCTLCLGNAYPAKWARILHSYCQRAS